MEIYNTLNKYIKEGVACMIVTVVEKNGEGPLEVGKKMLVTEMDEAYGTVGGGAIEYEARERCKNLIQTGTSELRKYSLTENKVIEDAQALPMACGGVATLFFEYIGVKAHVYIFGAGHVGKALTKILKTMNYHLTVVDDRKEVIGVIEGADRKVHTSFVDFIETEEIHKDSYIIVCTPSHKYDYNVLHKVIEKDIRPKYIGMLCSLSKLKDYLNKTYEAYGKDVNLDNFYSPIGLDTGGGSPEEIAVSIAAEILSVQYNKSNHNHMRGDY